MTQRTDIQTADERQYETPTFDPRSAFAGLSAAERWRASGS